MPCETADRRFFVSIRIDFSLSRGSLCDCRFAMNDGFNCQSAMVIWQLDGVDGEKPTAQKPCRGYH
jgi:hypothetical protein